MVVSQTVASGPETKAPPARPAPEGLYLAGRPALRDYVQYVRGHAISPPDRGTLVEQWQAAHSFVNTLERVEAGAADSPTMEALGPRHEPLLLEFFKDPIVRLGFNTLPTDIVIVSLDRLVVYQKHIDLTFARQLCDELGDDPDEQTVFRACLNWTHPQPPVSWSSVQKGAYVFLSPSSDMRFLGATSLRPEQLAGQATRGAMVGMVGISVGFGSNFLNAFYAGGRLILNNGSHRAYALRAAGITHVPCIVQHVAGRDELDLVAPEAVRRDPALYLDHPRPPMLKDYFHPQLHTIMPLKRRVKQVTVRFQVEESYIPALDDGRAPDPPRSAEP